MISTTFIILLLVCLSTEEPLLDSLLGLFGFRMTRSEIEDCPEDADSRLKECKETIDGLDKTDRENCDTLLEMQKCIEDLVAACRDTTDSPFIEDLGSGDDTGGELSTVCDLPD